MGQSLSNLLFNFWHGKQELRVVMLGLDGAGKTTVLFKMKLGEVTLTIPTIGFNVETLEYKNIRFTVWDVGGQTRIRPLWNHYYPNSRAIIYVVDSNDRQRVAEAREILLDMLQNDHLRDALLLVFANKQDLPEALPVAALTEQLGLGALPRPRRWHVQATCATSGEGLYEGLNWLSAELNKGT